MIERTMQDAPASPAGELVRRGDVTAPAARDWADIDAAVEHHITNSVAPNTRRAYQQAWQAFSSWCDHNGLPAEPTAATTARWLADAAAQTRPDSDRPRWSVSTLALRLSGIGQAAKAMGLPSPTDDPAVQRVLAGIRREHSTRTTKKAPLLLEQVGQVLACMNFTQWPDAIAAHRDAAVLLVGLAGAFRRSELVSLNCPDFAPNPKGDGAVHVVLRRSKTDQSGDGTVKYLPRGTHPSLCPACAVWRWVKIVHLADTGAGRDAWMRYATTTNRDIHICQDPPPTLSHPDLPWLRPIVGSGFALGYPDVADSGDDPRRHAARRGSRWGRPGTEVLRLAPPTVAAIVKARLAAAGFNPTRYSGHSMRAGFITEAFSAGADVRSIQRQSGHVSTTALTGYDRDYTPGNNNAVNVLGF